MDEDGAHEGILPERALATLLGGEVPPPPTLRINADQMRAWIDGAPDEPRTYDDYPALCARFILRLWASDPAAVQLDARALWERLVARFPQARQTLRGLSGYQMGYALNAARRLNELPPVPNPAILRLPAEGDDGGS